jgi:hypothetical protein
MRPASLSRPAPEINVIDAEGLRRKACECYAIAVRGGVNQFKSGGIRRMYVYTIQAMPGQKAKFEGDPSVKYRVRRVDDSIAVAKKGRSEIIRENLEYSEAVELVNGFNNVEGKSQVMRDEATRQKNGS